MIIAQPQQCHESHGHGPATDALELEQSMSNVIDDSSSFMQDDISHQSSLTAPDADVGTDWFPRFDLSCFDWNESYHTDHFQASYPGGHKRTASLSSRRKRKLCTGLVRSPSLSCLPSTLESSYSSGEEEPTTFPGGVSTPPSFKKRKKAMLTSRLVPLVSSRHASSCAKEAHMGVDWYIDCWVHDHNQKNPASSVPKLPPREQHMLLDCPFPAPFLQF